MQPELKPVYPHWLVFAGVILLFIAGLTWIAGMMVVIPSIPADIPPEAVDLIALYQKDIDRASMERASIMQGAGYLFWPGLLIFLTGMIIDNQKR